MSIHHFCIGKLLRRGKASATLLLACVLSFWRVDAAFSRDLIVCAAASLTDVLEVVSAAYERETNVNVTMTFAASSILARQIEAGAPADVFISADEEWMSYLQARNLIKPGSRQHLLSNHLVLIAPATSKLELKIAPTFALAAALRGGRLAIGDPATVPAGRYARQALTSLGVWDSIASQLAPAENVRSALALVARGETPLGIVYKTDALREKAVRVLGTFPKTSHAEIVYPIALTAHSHPAAAGFTRFLQGPRATKIFRQFGFKVPARERQALRACARSDVASADCER